MKKLLTILYLLLSSVMLYGQYTYKPEIENCSDFTYNHEYTQDHIVSYNNIKYNNEEYENLIKSIKGDTTQYAIIATGLGYSYTLY